MKKNIMRLFALAAITAAASLASCSQDEGTLYTPAADACYSFANASQVAQVTADDNGVIEVPVYRGVSSSAQTIDLTVAYDDEATDVFSVENTKVSFEAGQNVAYVKLNFDLDKMGATTSYVTTLTIPESNLSPSATASIAVKVSRQLTWSSIGTGTYTSEIFGDSWDQPVEKAAEGNIYRLPDCIVEGYPLIFSLSDDGQKLLSFGMQATGYVVSNYGMTYFYWSSTNAMVRQGNTIALPLFLVVLNADGSIRGSLASGYEQITLPE